MENMGKFGDKYPALQSIEWSRNRTTGRLVGLVE